MIQATLRNEYMFAENAKYSSATRHHRQLSTSTWCCCSNRLVRIITIIIVVGCLFCHLIQQVVVINAEVVKDAAANNDLWYKVHPMHVEVL